MVLKRGNRGLFVLFGTRPSQRARPILERQALHAAKLTRVVGHKPESEAARVRGYEQIVCANHLTAFLQIGSNLRVMERRIVVEVERMDVGEECAERGRILRTPW